jgi:hypothetical protein
MVPPGSVTGLVGNTAFVSLLAMRTVPEYPADRLFAASSALTCIEMVALAVALPGHEMAKCVAALLTTEIALVLPLMDAVVVSDAVMVVF